MRHFPEIQVDLGYSTNSYLTGWSSTFDSNWATVDPHNSVMPVQFWKGSFTQNAGSDSSSPRNFLIKFDAQTPFVYYPSAGHLVAQIRTFVAPSGTLIYLDYSGGTGVGCILSIF